MPVRFHHETLENGLQVIAEVDATAHTAAIGFFVKTGARDEDASIMGVSHFLEHMMFKGSETRRAEEVDRAFDDIGADHNAYTTSELTAFWSHCLPEQLDVAESVLSDILRPALREEDFDNEKKVILEEIAMYQDQPFWVLYERAMEVFYDDHPLSHRILGTEQTISSMTRDQMASYFHHRYSSDNTVVALAGKLDFDAAFAHLQEHCGSWQRTGVRRAYPAAPETCEEFTLQSSTAGRHYLLILCPAPPLNDDRRYAAGMLMQVLGDTDGSRLYWALIETGLAEDAAAQFDGRDGLGDFLVYCSCSPEGAAEVERIAYEQMQELADSLTEDDLLRVRSRVATAATLHSELPSGRMRRLGRLWTYTGAYRSLDEELEKINAVTLADLRELARQYPLEPHVIGRLTPGGEG